MPRGWTGGSVSTEPRGSSTTEEPRRTAYVEFVATELALQGRGLGTAVMERIAVELAGRYPAAGLCTGSPGFYARLGWRTWRGPLGIRRPSGGILPTPGEIGRVLKQRMP